MKSKHSIWLAAIAVAPFLASGLWAETRSAGSELRVSSPGQERLRAPAAAWTGADRALVVWDNEISGLRGRYLGADGAAKSAELGLVANQNLPGIPGSGTVVSRKDAALVPLTGGDFFLFWTEEKAELRVDYFYEDRQVTDRDVVGQRFNAAGAPVGARFRINSETSGFQSRPKAITLSTGEILVVFESDDQQGSVGPKDGIFGRVMSAAGRALTDVFKINAEGKLPAANPALAADARGNFLVSWESGRGRELDVFARLFDHTGAGKGQAVRVNADVPGLQRRPAVAADPAGGFLVAWQGQVGNDWRKARIFGQALNGAGALQGQPFEVSSGYGLAQISPAIAATPGHTFLVSWIDYDGTFPLGLAGVQIDAHGPRGSELWINDATLGAQYQNSLASAGGGRLLVPYEGFLGDDAGINARLLTVN
jgi:hypothetical protein